MTKFDTTEFIGIRHELRSGYQLRLLAHLQFYLMSFNLCGLFELFHLSLGGKAFLIGTINSIPHIGVVFRHQHDIFRHEREERYLILCHHCKFRHNLNLVTLVLRELILHFKCTDGIDVITKEIDTIRIFATIGVDIEDRTTQGELSRLIYIIYFTKAKLPKRLLDIRDRYCLVFLQHQCPCVQCLLRDHHFCQSLRIGDDISSALARQTGHNLGSEDL